MWKMRKVSFFIEKVQKSRKEWGDKGKDKEEEMEKENESV